MPGESVAAYINNIITFIIFILICIIIFIILYLISAIMRKKVLGRNPGIPLIETDVTDRGKSFNEAGRRMMADPFKRKNTALLGMSFILMMLLIVLMLASLYFSLNTGMSIIIGLIGSIIFSIIIVLAYMARSGIIKK